MPNTELKYKVPICEKRAAENKAAMGKIIEAYKKRDNQYLKEAFKIDVSETEFDSPTFSWFEFRETVVDHCAKIREANSATAFGQLMRAGINNIANNWYVLADTVHDQYVQRNVSNKLLEPYAPLHRGQLPSRTGRGENFKETKFAGLDIVIQNYKYGAITPIERELVDDDQTGQILQRARDIGENMAIVENAWSAQRFIGTAGTIGDDVIPASETYSSGVWSTSLTGGGVNRLTTYSVFSQENLQAMDLLLMQQKDLLGNKLSIKPDTILTGTDNKFPALTLMNSQWYAAVNAQKIGGNGTQTSEIGTNFASNVMKGLYNVVVDRYLPTSAYALGVAGRGLVFQVRDPLEVVQENPMSGPAFQMDVLRFRSRARWNVDWVDPRFWILGNDGSVTKNG